jgi:hypothetical protein
MQTPFAHIVEKARQLDIGSKQELADLLHAWLVEERREEILRNAQEAEQEHTVGMAKSGTIDNLMADLYASD